MNKDIYILQKKNLKLQIQKLKMDIYKCPKTPWPLRHLQKK